ncbi:MAG: cell wall hydrolase [Defluviimonas sp.]|nr:cell wall hydrolase [Defluviimonas sp.]
MHVLKIWAGAGSLTLALAGGVAADVGASRRGDPAAPFDPRLWVPHVQEHPGLALVEGARLAALAESGVTRPPFADAASLGAAAQTPPATPEAAAREAGAAKAAAGRAASGRAASGRAAAGRAASGRAASGGADAAPRVTDPIWLAAQPAPLGDRQFRCLATALYFEARGESLHGQAAVAEVILNRVETSAYPDSICGVVNQKGDGGCQFSFACDGKPETVGEPRAWDRAARIARAMLDGAPRRLTRGATHFHSVAVTPGWSRSFIRTARIGAHVFYRPPMRLVTSGAAPAPEQVALASAPLQPGARASQP